MKSKHRLAWMKWHAYLACFFLPLALLYTVTGTLYMLDLHGSNREEIKIELNNVQSWPEEENAAYQLASEYLPQEYGAISGKYFSFGGGHSWYGFNREVLLLTEKKTLEVHIHGWWKKLIMIHKGHAHIGFWIVGIALGLSLFFSLLSGVVLAYSNPRYRLVANRCMALGTVLLVALYFAPIHQTAL
ncbi:hypothetical protein [Pseudoteredinibacter isoporae]|uniref:PepSY-associated TM region n=1 Tax=Pseudoteredinibacter isoporae TaxID=570281 RepID=A0A7X0MVU0_9GAMM|nr:hypothetical protein [Pseudoteredinibacter isoporae]MBB6521475.1 hypothetical protein [Pseudoteredinibacter isoporae]NHO87029.1 hypothetical protein [Pseudoteredinibacter isoporae]NIB24518.1 hypothetical protein [Pseudoteredinibacter isoporae]